MTTEQENIVLKKTLKTVLDSLNEHGITQTPKWLREQLTQMGIDIDEQ